jgi:hypothetical protein
MKYKSAGSRRRAQRATSASKKPYPKAKATPKKATNLKKTTSADGTTATYSNSNRRAQASSKVTGGVKTKAGTYKVYGKQTAAAKNFRSAFANAKKAGYKTFTWEGKKYSTKTK